MSYPVKQLAKLAGVTPRTLHHYDEIGLLTPTRVESNGYRHYESKDLLRLQQIMFFRELDFPLKEIQKILSSPHFDMTDALRDHRQLIHIKKKRLDNLLKTIDNTLKKITTQHTMKDTDLYDGFSKEESEVYAKEAKERWGHTDAYKQSVGKYESLSKEQKLKMKQDSENLMNEIVANMDKKPSSPEVQALIQRHYGGLRFFYEPTLEIYRGLANMYVDDPRFTAYYEKYATGLATFMRDAMYTFCDANEK